jgi:glycosyltransferase involved in cell wall biosynthesis
MKVSVVTVTYNAAATLADTLRSVAAQTWPDVEHIVVDGMSSDNTAELVAQFQRAGGIYIREPDKGLYDAMNKGIDRASGDIIGTLNADDLFADEHVLAKVVAAFGAEPVDAILGDVAFFRDDADQLVRRYNSGRFTPARLAWGWMPSHPGMYLTREAYDRVGRYRTDYRIAADYEFAVRAFVSHRLPYMHLPAILVKMRMGGVSTSGLRAKWTINRETVRACRENGVYSNVGMVLTKYPRKLLELVR